jgi:hypothetical protein
MSDAIEFVTNYSDLSTDNGFQYEFRCGKCGSGFRTKFRPWAIATATNVADAIGSALGGIFGTAADMGRRVKSSAWEKAHDEAYQNALEEIKPNFIQCPRCNEWVCRKGCWNEKKGLCKSCAPDLGVEMAAAQASRSVEEVWAHAAMAEEDKKLDTAQWRENIRATCPKCETHLETNSKFCPSCGFNLKEKHVCPQCGEKLTENAKFCAGCGAKIGE